MKLTDLPLLRNFTQAQLLTFFGVPAAQPGQIIGLNPQWTSSTVLGCSSGSCFIESLGYSVYGAPADITPSSPSNNTWYHIYAYVASTGVLTLEAATAAPVAFATPAGFARSKTSDTTRRYLYSARTNGSGNFYQFFVTQGSLWLWRGIARDASPFRALNGGTQTTSTAVDCSAVIPTTSSMGFFAMQSPGTNNLYIDSADVTVTTSSFSQQCGSVGITACPCSVSSTQNLNYIVGAATTGYIDVSGFYLQR